MFKCEILGVMSQPGDKVNKITAVVREKSYLNEEDVVIGRGFEIVKELNATERGLARWKEMGGEPIVISDK